MNHEAAYQIVRRQMDAQTAAMGRLGIAFWVSLDAQTFATSCVQTLDMKKPEESAHDFVRSHAHAVRANYARQALRMESINRAAINFAVTCVEAALQKETT